LASYAGLWFLASLLSPVTGAGNSSSANISTETAYESIVVGGIDNPKRLVAIFGVGDEAIRINSAAAFDEKNARLSLLRYPDLRHGHIQAAVRETK